MRRSDPDTYPVAFGGPAPLPAPADAIIAALVPHVTPARWRRMQAVAAARSYAVQPVLESFHDPHNASAVLRSCDAFGIQRVHVVPGEEEFLAARKVSRGTDRWLELVRHEAIATCLGGLREAGFKVFVASMEGDVHPAELATEPKVAVVFGNERKGPSPSARELADGTYAVPMRGFVESLNVSVAAAITLQAVMRGRPGDLSAHERQALEARYLMTTLASAEAILRERGVLS
ncbi:MAG: RNA methyltransferase [Myxococcota bacterium]